MSGVAKSASVSNSEQAVQQRLHPEGSIDHGSGKPIPDPAYITHHPRPMAVCTFGLRQLGNGLCLSDRRWDLLRATIRAAVCTERSSHPPPLKKLCVESRLPPVPESLDPSDPYNFTCSDAGVPVTSLASHLRTTPLVNSPAAVTTSVPQLRIPQQHSPSIVSKPTLATSNLTAPPTTKPSRPKPQASKVNRTREGNMQPSSSGNSARNVSSSAGIPAKKKRTGDVAGNLTSSGIPATSSIPPLSAQTVTLTTVTSAHSLPTLPFPLTLGDQLGAISRLQMTAPLLNRNNLTISPALVRSQALTALQGGPLGPPSSGLKDGSVMVTGMDVLNGQMPVTSTLLHSVTVSRHPGSTPTLLAAPTGGLGITLGTPGVMGQLSQLQKSATLNDVTARGASNKGSNVVTSLSHPLVSTGTLLTTATNTSGAVPTSSAKVKVKSRKSASKQSVVAPANINHASVCQALGVGLLIEGAGGGMLSAALGSANSGSTANSNSHSSPQAMPSPSTTPSPLLRSDSVTSQVPVSSSLPNGLGSSPPPNPHPKGLSNHTMSVSPSAYASIPSPIPDLPSPNNANTNSKGKGSSRHSSGYPHIHKAQTTAPPTHGTLHFSMAPAIVPLGNALVSQTSHPGGSQGITYQQVFTSQMLSPAQLSQIQIQTTTATTTSTTMPCSKTGTIAAAPTSLTLTTASLPIKLPLLTSGLTAAIASASQQPHLLLKADDRRREINMQGSPSLPS